MSGGIYLDNSMTTRPSLVAVSAMMPFLRDQWGVPSAPHAKGTELISVIERSYRSLYRLLGASEGDTVLLTSCGAESVNQVISSAYTEVTLPTGKNQFVTTQIEEAPILMAMNHLEKMSCVIRSAKPNALGVITPEAIGDVLTARTALLSMSWANALTGVIHPVAEIGRLCRERGILFHLDASHVLGKHFFDLEETGAHFISFNGDNMHAPKGTGGLWIRRGTPCAPLIYGGMEQGGLRAGALNIPGLVALSIAADEAVDSRDLVCTEVARFRNQLETRIKEVFPDTSVFYKNADRLPHVTAMGFPGVENEAFLYALNRKGVYACLGGGSLQRINLVLMAAGVDKTLSHTALNFSLSRETTESDIEKAAVIIGETAKKLQKFSGSLYPGVHHGS